MGTTDVSAQTVVSGKVTFHLDNPKNCLDRYMRELNGTPIVGATVWSVNAPVGADSDVTDIYGNYGVIGYCDSNHPYFDVGVADPEVAYASSFFKCNDSGYYYDFPLPHPEEAKFTVNGLPKNYWDSYNLVFCDPSEKKLELNLLGKWLQYGTKYRITIQTTTPWGQPTGDVVFDHTVTNLHGLPQTINLQDFLNYFVNTDPDLDETYYIELQVGNCNGWKPKKHHALVRLKDWTGLTFGGFMFMQRAPISVPIDNTSCQQPIPCPVSGRLDFSSIVSSIDKIWFKISQYNAQTCLPTGKVLNGVTIDWPVYISNPVPYIFVSSYFHFSLQPDNSDIPGLGNGSPDNSTTGTNFYDDDFDEVNPIYAYEIEIHAANPCKTLIESFWIFPDSKYKLDFDRKDQLISVVGNPVNDRLKFDYYFEESYKKLSLKIYNVLGQVVYSSDARAVEKGTGTLEYDLPALPGGTYIYTMTADGRLIDKGKFIK